MRAGFAELASRHDVTVSGSVLAVPRADRLAVAARLTAAGLWTHADMMTGRYRGQPGLEAHEIHDLSEVPEVRLDVHVMCDDAEAVVGRLPRAGVRRLTVQVDDEHAARRAAAFAERADELWLAIDPRAWVPDASCGAPGVASGYLVMLTPPGQPGHTADLDRLAAVRLLARSAPVGVDGGVTEANLPAVAAAGAGYAVAGRALLG